MAGQYQIYFAYDDPLMLGHAFMVGGLLCLVRRQLTSRTIVAAALLMLAGGFTEHSLIALPLATTVWLFLRNIRVSNMGAHGHDRVSGLSRHL